jgi:hypothetical protein
MFPHSGFMNTKSAAILIAAAFGLMAVLPNTHAVVPTPDGCYPNYTTAEGCRALQSLTSGLGNTAIGWYSLFGDTTASFNTGIGAGALVLNIADNNTATGAGALLLNTTGTDNTANGVDALVFNDTGEGNTATGAFALFSNTDGNYNTANGEFALYFNTTGERNTAIGDSALYQNTTGSRNTAIGNPTLLNNTTADDNTAIGASALFNNVAGDRNTAIGARALYSNNTPGNTAFGNTATGADALSANTTGTYDTANGDSALSDNTTGTANTAVGTEALSANTTGFGNTAIGMSALSNSSGDGNIAVGAGSGNGVSTASDVICIGAGGQDVSNSCFIGQIFNATIGNGAQVLVNSFGQLGTAPSSKRFKDDIKPMDEASKVLFALEPVTFRYKKELDPQRIPQFGLVAEDVEKVNPDLVVRDKEGKPYSVRYDKVNAMLLNEFLKEHKKVQALELKLAQQQKNFESKLSKEEKQIESLTAGLQKVTAQIEMTRSAPQTIADSH